MALWLLLLSIGVAAGILSGMFGIGGGLVIVPALIFILKVKELEAIGTSLAALIPPVGLLGLVAYYRGGHVNLKYAAVLAIGLFAGAWFGAKIMMPLPPQLIRRIYGVFLAIVAARMLIGGK